MRTMLSTTLIFVAVCVAAAVVLLLYIYFSQERMIFYPRPNDAELREHWRWKRVEIPSGEQVLEGWWADGGAPESKLTLIYFGGNAEDVLYTARKAAHFHAHRMLVVNYRGYGGTKGKPGQDALFADALAIHDYVRGPGGADPRQIVVIGRSLGSGVATMVAARREVGGAILVTPFDSINAVAKRHFPPLIIDWLLRHPFPSTEFAPNARVPALFLIAADDRVIAPAHAYALAKVWGGSKQTRSFSNVGHNDIDTHPQYYDVVNEFLASLAAKDQHREQ